MIDLTVKEPARADRAVAAAFPGASRRRVAALFAAGAVHINGNRARKGDPVKPGDHISLDEPPATDDEMRPKPEELPLEVLFADAHLVAVDKPAGLPSHPLAPRELGTAANRLVALFPDCAGAGADPREGGLINRLDRGTSGVLLAARDRASWTELRRQISAGEIDKEYLALVTGDAASGESSAPLRTAGGRAKVAPGDPRALPAHTRWEPVERRGETTLLRVFAKTGRMHQVRAHLAAAGHPVVGDPDYGGPAAPERVGHYLHAARVRLRHPESGEPLEIEAPLPRDWAPA